MRECCPYREAKFQGRLWDPRSLNPLLWLDVNYPGVLTFSGSNVASVRDIVQGVTFSATGSITADTSQMNGLITLRINNASSSQYLQASYSFNSSKMTLVSLHRNIATSTGRTIYGRLWSMYLGTGQDYNNLNGCALLYGVGGVNGVRFYRNAATVATTSPTINDVWGNVVLTRDGTAATISLDGGTRVSGSLASNNVNIDTVRIGNDRSAVDSGMNGYIAEQMMFDRALTLREEQLLTGSMAWDRGRQNTLPSGHPFRNRPPLIGD